MTADRNIVLEDERVMLRRLETADVRHLISFSENESEIWKFSLFQPNSPEKLSEYVISAIDAGNNGTEYPFIVFDKASDRYAGSTRFYDINLPYRTVQLGYTWYGKEFWGTGLNAHCKFLLLQYAFEDMGMERVEFRADNNNKRSIAAMKRIGCTIDGVLRSNMPTADSDSRRDSIVLSILREEWFARVKNNLKGQLR